jgi:hypothetical protein
MGKMRRSPERELALETRKGRSSSKAKGGANMEM